MLDFNSRKNAQCPRCRSLERHRLFWEFLTNRKLLNKDGFRLMHVAPEISLLAKFKKNPKLKYYAIDLDNPYANYKMNLTELKFEDSFFDGIICSHVLEHIVDDGKALNELFRVLKPGGWAILQVPMRKGKTYEDKSIVSEAERTKHYGQKDHVRIYGEEDYYKLLEQHSFNVEVVDFAKDLKQENITRMRLSYKKDQVEEIIFCKKN